MHTRLRRERLARGMTLRELAAEIGGVTHANLAFLERGKTRSPRPGLRLRMERYFRLPIEVLLMPDPGHANGSPEAAVQEFATTSPTVPTATGGTDGLHGS